MGTQNKDRAPPNIERLRADLRKLRDEVRLKVHLGEMEAKDRWVELRPKLERAERDLTVNLAALGEEVRSVADGLRAEIRDMWSDLAE